LGRRGGSVCARVDLHEIIANGDSPGNVEIKPDDTLLIPANRTRIAILGGIQQPGYYDLRDGKALTFADAVSMAHSANKRANWTM
jgi:protein involved in polysaccharide export with SLBB domain